MEDKQRYQDGMTVRRKVLGDAHVDRTLQHLTPLNDEFQDFITRYAWGETWTRPGLDHHTRSMITIAMLIALNREAELKMHLRASFNNYVNSGQIALPVDLLRYVSYGAGSAQGAASRLRPLYPRAPASKIATTWYLRLIPAGCPGLPGTSQRC